MSMRPLSTRCSIASAIVLLCGSAGSLMGQTAHFGQPGTTKVRIPNELVTPQLMASGAVLVARYESFSIVEMRSAAVPAEAEALPDENRILLNAGALDTSTREIKALQQARGQFAGKSMQLVQFAGPIQPAWYDSLRATGVEVVTYIPSNSYLVYGNAKQIANLEALAAADASVQWTGAYRDQYRIDPAAARMMTNPKKAQAKNQLFAIQLVRDPVANPGTFAVVERLRTGDVVRSEPSLNYYNIIAPIQPADLGQIAAQQDVVSIQPYTMPVLFDERQDQIVAGNLSGGVPSGPGYLNWLASKGFTQAQFTASNFAVDVTDSGIDNATTSPNHFGLYVNGVRPGTSRIIYNRLVGTPHAGSTLQGCDGHGTLNTHIVLGYNNLGAFPHLDATGYHYGLGVCPFTRAGSSVIFDPSTFTSPNYTTLQSQAYNDGARISTNSWGASTGGVYNTDCQSYDALVRDAQPAGSPFPTAGNQEMIIVFAAGNAGSGAGSVGSPGSGKNVFCIGAAEGVQTFGGSDGCGEPDALADNANDIATFSSRGPCTDGRKKPDLCAPGTHISGGVAQIASPGATGNANACYTGSGVCGGVSSIYFPPGQQYYTASSGTSHSTPCVAGGAALVRQFFINQGMTPPSPAMTKSFLMNSARYMNGSGANDNLYSNNQGMGEMNLGEAFNRITAAPTLLRDELAADMFTATGQTRVFAGNVTDGTKPFRVTLAWTDAPGATSGSAFKNNLDLTVTAGPNTYKGNVFSGANSVTGGVADAANNVESVFLPAGFTGGVTITVTATNINSDGVPNVGGALDQDFALVGYNFVGGNPTPSGACCIPSSLSCAIVTAASCTSQGGTYFGDNVTCAVANCPSPGACCLPNNTCQQLTPAACVNANGVYNGNNTTCPVAPTQTFVSTNVPLPIPDVSTVNSTLTVGPSFSILKATVNLDINHTYDSDLIISLIGPGGAPTVVLANRVGGSGDNFTNTTFDDAAATSISSGAAPFTGTFQPSPGPLSAFNGLNSAGVWTLRIQDAAAADVGTLNSWNITLTSGVVANCIQTCYANCDSSTTPPVLNVLDFACFLNRFSAGCP